MHRQLEGHIFGNFTVIKLGEPYISTHPQGYQKATRWLCRCICGAEKLVRENSLIRGDSLGCGCTRKPNLIHGGKGTKEYRAWLSIRKRCTRMKDKCYAAYGGRGISVCPQGLNSFDTFLLDMGLAPTKTHEIDRIDNDGNYEPGNCRWATRKEQMNNTRRNIKIEYDGIVLTQTQWAEKLKLSVYNFKKMHKQLSISQIIELSLNQ